MILVVNRGIVDLYYLIVLRTDKLLGEDGAQLDLLILVDVIEA